MGTVEKTMDVPHKEDAAKLTAIYRLVYEKAGLQLEQWIAADEDTDVLGHARNVSDKIVLLEMKYRNIHDFKVIQ